jgi:hypothetical protein
MKARGSEFRRTISVHSIVGNSFRFGPHLPRAVHYLTFRARTLRSWQQVSSP